MVRQMIAWLVLVLFLGGVALPSESAASVRSDTSGVSKEGKELKKKKKKKRKKGKKGQNNAQPNNNAKA